tara:strand:- start:2492 stop:2731 length:240 start_codon:yes stop_codon:yes gene_type:complete
VKEELKDFFNKQSDKVKARVRKEAVKIAEENCIKYGKKIEEFTLEEWKELVAIEEEELIKRVWKFGGMSAIAFGFMPWW